MYTITCDNVTLHNINLGLMVISAKCSLEVNKTGSLTFFVAPEHPYKTAIKNIKNCLDIDEVIQIVQDFARVKSEKRIGSKRGVPFDKFFNLYCHLLIYLTF